MFPLFAKASALDASGISWMAMDANLREQMLVKMDVEAGRMAMYIRDILLTAHVKANGFSSVDPARLQKSIDAVVETYGLGSMTTPGQVYVDRFLPPKAGRMPLPQGVAAPAAP